MNGPFERKLRLLALKKIRDLAAAGRDGTDWLLLQDVRNRLERIILLAYTESSPEEISAFAADLKSKAHALAEAASRLEELGRELESTAQLWAGVSRSLSGVPAVVPPSVFEEPRKPAPEAP